MASSPSVKRHAAIVLGLLSVTGGACGFGSSAQSGTGGTGGLSGAGAATGSGAVGAAGRGATGMGAGTGTGTAGAGGSRSGTGRGGNGGGFSACVPGMQAVVIIPCGYPSASGTSLSSVAFNEDEVLRAIDPSGSAPLGTVRLFYSDEHALTLGVRQVVVKTAAGTTMTDYPVSPLTTDPAAATNPQTGTNMLAGDESGLDVSLRPMWPVLFLTDITADPNNRAGDWQQGGVPRSPDAIFGSWKAAVRTVDKTVTPNAVSIAPDADPAKNNWNLGGGDPVPAGLTNQGYGAEARWSVSLSPGHNYRVQVLVHDGDQNKAGGDSGEACVDFCAGGSSTEGSGGAGGSGEPPPMCPSGYTSCGPGGVAPASCPTGTVCANGCCLIQVG